MLIRVDMSDHRLRVRMDPGKQPVIHLPVPPHLPGRNAHQWEESQKDTEMQHNCRIKNEQKYSQMYELLVRQYQNM